MLHASQVASCIGANRYAKPAEAFEKVWQRVSPHTFQSALRRHALKTDEQRLDEIMARHETVAHAFAGAKAAAASAHVSAAASNAHTSGLQVIEATPLDAADKKIVEAALRKTAYTTFGTERETDIFEAVRAKLPFDIVRDDAFRHVKMGEAHGVPWSIGGRIDGISADGSTILEIKQRVNRLFLTPPAYEAVQIQCYIQMVPAALRAMLVESFCPPDGSRLINVMPLERDDEAWERDIVPKAQAFVEYLIRLIDNEALQDEYLGSKRRSSLVTKGFPS
jgi:hypothetical protein